jgi:hypothetical protein
MVVRLGIPPLDIIPGFHLKFLSGGIICVDSPSANCEEKRLAKIRTDAPGILDDLKCEIGHFIVSLQANLTEATVLEHCARVLKLLAALKIS